MCRDTRFENHCPTHTGFSILVHLSTKSSLLENKIKIIFNQAHNTPFPPPPFLTFFWWTFIVFSSRFRIHFYSLQIAINLLYFLLGLCLYGKYELFGFPNVNFFDFWSFCYRFEVQRKNLKLFNYVCLN